MKNPLIRIGIVSLIAEIAIGFASPAWAWSICNKTAGDVWTAIAYDDGQGYTSSGWWKLRSCGGCATVFSGSPKLKGVFYTAETPGSTYVWHGDNLFCVDRAKKFKLGADVNSVRGACENRGLSKGSFLMTTLGGNKHTTNLTGRVNGKVCID